MVLLHCALYLVRKKLAPISKRPTLKSKPFSDVPQIQIKIRGFRLRYNLNEQTWKMFW